MKSLVSRSLVCILLLSAGSASAGSASYTVTDLGTLGGGSISYAISINASGQVVGYATTGSAVRAFLYSGGIMTDLGTLGGFADSIAEGINAGGQVVGYAYTMNATATTRAFLYSGGIMTDLGTLGGSYSVAYGINSSGQVVGSSATTGTVYPDPGHAFLYSGGGMADLGTLGGSSSIASSINAGGQAVGYSDTTGDVGSHAFLYSGGRMADLGTLGGSSSTAHGINASGQVVGTAATADDFASHAFLYSGGNMTDLGTLGGFTDSVAYGINASGQVVGNSYTTYSFRRAFLYSGGIMTDLNSLLPANSGWVLTDATAINDSGQIVGSGSINGQQHAFLLNPSGYGIDLSDVPSSSEWTNLMANFNPTFVIADAWGGGSEKPAQQILASAPTGLKKAAYLLLNYDDPSQSGPTQVGYALEALGSEYQPGNANGNLAFLAVDIEPVCDGHFDANGNCVDSSGNDDWENLPQDLNSIAARFQEIYGAVQAVERAGLNPVIYSSRGSWAQIAGGRMSQD